MSRFHFSVLAILLIILVALNIIEKRYYQSLPHISLPIESHNTIGELPIISQADSGGVEHFQQVAPRRGWGYIQVSPNRGFIASSDAMAITYVSSDSVTYQ